MGTGYSNNFTGTAGAIGDNRFHQLSLTDELPVRTKTNRVGAGVVGGVGVFPATRMKQCSCCGEYTIPSGTENEVCPICGWIDDKFQNTHPDSLNGRNPICLNDAREAYKKKCESGD